MIKHALKLCLITDAQHKPLTDYLAFIHHAVMGGVTMVQLREKSLSAIKLRDMATQLKALLTPLHIPLIINDHVELAEEINADGVHLGQTDSGVLEARQCLGPDKIIGLSIESFAELEAANRLSCIDYVAASAVFPSASKQNCKTIWGLDGLSKLVRLSNHLVVAIGGINQHNITDVLLHGACGVAVISAIHSQSDAKVAALALSNPMEK